MSSKPKAKGRSKRVAPDQVEEAWTTEGREKPRDRLSTKEKYSTLGSDRSALYEKDDEVEPMAPAAPGQLSALVQKKGKSIPVRIRDAYTWVFVFAALAVFLVIWEVEMVTRAIVRTGWEQSAISGFTAVGQNIDGRIKNDDLMRMLKVGLLISVTIQTGLYMRYHTLLTEYETQRKGERHMDEQKWSRRLGLTFDVVLGMLHIPFFWDWSFHWYTFRSYGEGDMPWIFDSSTQKYGVPYHIDMASMFLVLPFNVALIPRLVLYHSELWTEGAALASLADVEVSVGVAIRAGFTRSPGRYLFFLLAFPFVTCSLIFSNCERLVIPMYGSQHHAAWASYISLTTVGYGNDEAQTQCGRSVSMVLIILGIMGTSMLISKVEDAMHMDRSQQTVMRMIAEMERAAKVREHAALLIQKVWRAYHPAGQYERQSQAKRFKAMEQAFRELSHIRKSPLEFDADFETRMEQTVWDLQEQVTDLKELLRKEQEETRMQVMRNLAKMQGLMLQTVLQEIRKSSGVDEQAGAERSSGGGGGGEGGGPGREGRGPGRERAGRMKEQPKSSSAEGDPGDEEHINGRKSTGNPFTAMATAKKAKARSRRLSRE